MANGSLSYLFCGWCWFPGRFYFLGQGEEGTRYKIQSTRVLKSEDEVLLSWRKILQNVRIEEVGEIMNTGLLRTVLRPAVSPSLTPPAPRKEHCGFNAEALRGILYSLQALIYALAVAYDGCDMVEYELLVLRRYMRVVWIDINLARVPSSVYPLFIL